MGVCIIWRYFSNNCNQIARNDGPWGSPSTGTALHRTPSGAIVAERLRCRCLVVRGGRSEIFSNEAAACFAARFANGAWTAVPDAGHNVQGDNPAGLITALFAILVATGRIRSSGKSLNISTYAILPTQKWENVLKEELAKSGGRITAGLEFVGCVLYEFDHSIHKTFFAYQISRGGSPLGAQLDQIDPKEFIFTPSIGTGAFDAD